MTDETLIHRLERWFVIASLLLFAVSGGLMVYALDYIGEFDEGASVALVAGVLLGIGGFGLSHVARSWVRGGLNA